VEWDTETIIILLAGLLLFLLGFLLGQRSSKRPPSPPQNQWETPTAPLWEQPYPSIPAPPILPPLPPPRPDTLPPKPELMLDDLYRM